MRKIVNRTETVEEKLFRKRHYVLYIVEEAAECWQFNIYEMTSPALTGLVLTPARKYLTSNPILLHNVCNIQMGAASKQDAQFHVSFLVLFF